MVQQVEFSLSSYSRGFHLITQKILEKLPKLPDYGVLNLFIKHTSAAISLNENADPTVRRDFETFINKVVPEGYNEFIHTLEGSDDMPAHIKSSLFGQYISVPITNGKLNLGTWQGIYLCEFRNNGGARNFVATIIS